jgi:hypothetical protein
MATQVSLHSIWRDARMVTVLLVWAAFVVALLMYFNDEILPHSVAHPAAPGVAAASRAAVDDEIYTGSLILVPHSGDECRKLLFDNRSGMMWEGGSFDCYAVAKMNESRPTLGYVRMKAIHSIFHK